MEYHNKYDNKYDVSFEDMVYYVLADLEARGETIKADCLDCSNNTIWIGGDVYVCQECGVRWHEWQLVKAMLEPIYSRKGII